ncbi:hypothetical protein NHH03_23740 [Stieleria sp. TO1_6]|nr:hypothetical protein [Stieleria tagensis]
MYSHEDSRQPMHPFSYRNDYRSLLQKLVFVLLLWPVPIPVGHCHDVAAESVLQVEELSRHLVWHHGGPANAGNWPQDWHVHWLLPAQAFASIGGDPSDCEVECLPASQFSAANDLDVAVLPTLGLFSVALHSVHYGASDPRTLSFQTVRLLTSRLSLPELSGVIRC